MLTIDNLVVENAPALAGLLSAISVVGIVEQMGNGGLIFTDTATELTISPNGIELRDGRANGPSMGITFEGLMSPERRVMDLQGVVSPLNILNGIGGALFARRGEGLFGFSYLLSGPMQRPNTEVNPLSILPPFRMHFMAGHVCDFDRQEGPCADMQGHLADLNPARRQSGQQRRIKMQRRSGRRNRAWRFGKHGLIIVLILDIGRPLGGNIGRQWHCAGLV